MRLGDAAAMLPPGGGGWSHWSWLTDGALLGVGDMHPRDVAGVPRPAVRKSQGSSTPGHKFRVAHTCSSQLSSLMPLSVRMYKAAQGPGIFVPTRSRGALTPSLTSVQPPSIVAGPQGHLTVDSTS